MKNLLNKKSKCPYYPCHKGLEDCTFCYCPLYPCGIKGTGGKWIEDKDGNPLWDCSECNIVHKKEFVDEVKKYMIELVKERIKGDE